MKNKNNIKHFLTRYGKVYPIAPNDPIIERWEPKDDITHQVMSIVIYEKDLHVSDRNKTTKKVRTTEKEIKKRSTIKKYSFGASKRLKFVMRNTAHLMEVIITLTYPREYPMDGSLVKKHLHKFIGWLRYRECMYIWILEFQESRGAPHFHLLIDKEIPHQDVAEIWYKIVNSGDEKHLRAGTETRAIRSKGAIAFYMTTYMNKAKQKEVPEEYKKVGKFWGCSRGLLKKTEYRLYGNPEDIVSLKEKLRIARQFDRGQKKQWERKAKSYGKKNKFKKFYNTFQSGIYSLKVTNSDKLLNELESRNLDTFPFSLSSFDEVPPLPLLEERRNQKPKDNNSEDNPQGSLGLSL